MVRKWSARLLVLAMLFSLFGTALPSAVAADSPAVAVTQQTSETIACVPREALLEADSLAQAQRVAQAYNAELKSYSEYGGIAVLLVPDAEAAVEQRKRLGLPKLSYNYLYQTADVKTADGAAQTQSTETDPDFPNRDSIIDTDRAWEITKGTKDVVVAVIDTGIDTDHPEFAGRISAASYNSYTDKVGLRHVRDDISHGTHVSGIIAGGLSNGKGGCGVAPGVTIMAIKANTDYENIFETASTVRGIYYAVKNGADIINMSFGRSYEDGADDLERKAIQYAVSKGVTVIAAAGNRTDGHADYPSAYSECISVSALSDTGAFAFDYSNSGPEVDIAAPGTVYSTVPGGYNTMFGTSMATPNVSGVAALVLSQNPKYTPKQVRAALCDTAAEAALFGTDNYYGTGVVNAYNALVGEKSLLTVTYRYNNGKKTNDTTAKVSKGGKLFKVWPKARSGYTFMGWYTDTKCVNPLDYDAPVNSALTLYAKWVKGEQEAPVEDFLFHEDKTNGLSITYYTGFSDIVVVPRDNQGQSITSIRARAISGRTYVKKVVLADTIREIGDFAFARNPNMTGIVLSDKTTRLGIGMLDDTKWFNKKAKGMVYIDQIAYQYKGAIPKNVAIKQGTTVIGPAAFANRTTGEKWYQPVFFPSNLRSVSIPNSVEIIMDSAFQGCSRLKSVTLPSSLRIVGVRAFRECSLLKKMHIPAKVSEINIAAFDRCTALQSITVAAKNKWYTASGGVLFSKDKKLLLQYPLGKTARSYAVPKGVQTIALWAFAGAQRIESVTFPASLIVIGGGAFYGCPRLKKATVPNTVSVVTDLSEPTLGVRKDTFETYYDIEESFRDCHSSFVLRCYENSAAYTFALVYTIPYITIGKGGINARYRDTSWSFSDNELCLSSYYGTRTKAVVIPSVVKRIGNEAFFGNANFTTVTIPSSVTAIGSGAFAECVNLTSVTIPKSVRSIGDGVFNGCTALQSVTLPASVDFFGEQSMFAECKDLKSVKLPKGTTKIGNKAFSGCTKLTSVTIPAGVTVIDDNAFENCQSLKTLTIPAEIRSVGKDAFLSCSSLTLTTHTNTAAHTYAQDNTIPVKLLAAYTITFNSNGGVGNMAGQVHASGNAKKLTGNGYSRKGYLFSGWAATAKGTVVYQNRASVKDLAADGGRLTLYAVWKKAAAPTKAVSGLKLKSGKTKRLTISYQKRAGADGYRIQYSRKANLSGAETVFNGKTSLTLTGLTAKKTYYVKVTAYRLDSQSNKVYSKKSVTKKLKIK